MIFLAHQVGHKVTTASSTPAAAFFQPGNQTTLYTYGRNPDRTGRDENESSWRDVIFRPRRRLVNPDPDRFPTIRRWRLHRRGKRRKLVPA